MPKQWWSSRSMFMAQGICLLGLFAWSVHHAPAETGKNAKAVRTRAAAPVSPNAGDAVIDNSEDTASTASASGTDPRFVAPPTIRFRTEHPPAGSLNLRPLDNGRSAPWQPVHPQNPPQRLPSGPRSPFEVNGSGATVYNAPPVDAE